MTEVNGGWGIHWGEHARIEINIEEDGPLPPAGTINFVTDWSVGREILGGMTIYVERSDNTYGQTSASWVTSDGSAIAGQDYTATYLPPNN